ncbi:hypothetical protein PZE06_22900 [Robertmurraya sp. DFI.2.37]|uniref:hypothetical protein n=1 Tax=Robertmurraya sp. DFI.2.37 TaxID=3031819 RepID=UPI001248E0D3|nr:hypothetical protein [Robertmurraya sp. DFI.2.37]MDF1510985.1 hypothetical protein [Robertmurraya sp. DFI.2.37]
MTDSERKFGWVDDWAKMTGERARIDAKVHKTAIVYNTKMGKVKEFYDGTIQRMDSGESKGGIMREKERINRIMSLLQRIWEQQSEMRFNQIISNLQHMYSSQNEGYGQRMLIENGEEVKSSYLDFFYLEDDKWEEFLQRMVDSQERDYK